MKKFEEVAANLQHPNWEQMVKRENKLYQRPTEIRSEFERDIDRICHSDGYKRLKHKTQVFFAPTNDHICTRMEHVNHVDNISYTIAHYLGLNTELTKAIALSHDIGHSPFGHKGEKILSLISEKEIGEAFWHEKNGLEFVDDIELLEDIEGKKRNLNLTYAVRDGIISHCGEIDENTIKPRQEVIDLRKEYHQPNSYQPYTWEACVVKIVDKISYIGRDIEDAIRTGILTVEKVEKLDHLLQTLDTKLNNTNIINTLVNDICEHSTPEKGICLSEEKLNMLNTIKKFNYTYIYGYPRMELATQYFDIVLRQLYQTLAECYDTNHTLQQLKKKKKEYSSNTYSKLFSGFIRWIQDYWDEEEIKNNKLLIHKGNEKEYKKAIISYIAGMTDQFAMECYQELISF